MAACAEDPSHKHAYVDAVHDLDSRSLDDASTGDLWSSDGALSDTVEVETHPSFDGVSEDLEEVQPPSDIESTDVAVTDLLLPPEPPINLKTKRSLVWIDPAVLECGLACILSKISPDGHGGRLIDAWFTRFATTFHSERLGPKQLLDAYFSGPAQDWNLDDLPFKVTAIHNRIDLMDSGHCGELRISLASMDPILKPFHLIFVFQQSSDETGCKSVASDWASLSELEADAFHAKANTLLDQSISFETFLVAETVEFIVAPWEWRQWFVEPSDGAMPWSLENRPLFQTVDTARLNKPGAERDEFLDWVSSHADSLDARTQLIPEKFRAMSVRVNQGVPWIPLDLTGVGKDILENHPTLRQNIEIVGCPGCHTADAEFVQTLPDSSFSEFYKKELEAREGFMKAVMADETPVRPFGPLQDNPILTP